MLGKTNACVGGSGGGSGETIEVLNKTGAVINQGDKVWINKNTQTTDISYVLDNTSGSWGGVGFINQTGLIGYSGGGKYSLSDTGKSYIGPQSNEPYTLYYTDTGNMYYNTRDNAFGNGNFITPTHETARTMSVLKNCKGYTGYLSLGKGSITKYNTNTQQVEQTWSITNIDANATFALIAHNRFYFQYASNRYLRYIEFYDDGTVSSSYVSVPYVSVPSGCFGNTIDEKYFFYTNAAGNEAFENAGALSILEVSKDTGEVKNVTNSVMPQALAKYTSSYAGCYTFNPKNGVLTACKPGTKTYNILKYENEVWAELPISLNLEEDETFYSGSNYKGSAITLSEDLSRACVRTNKGVKVFNLTRNTGYTAVPYIETLVDEQTITGTALNTVLPDEKLEVTTLLPESVEVTLTTEKDNIDITME
jgi:hypothetical protein